MARFTYPQNRLLAAAPAGGTGLGALNGLLVRVYSDSGATVLADIRTTGGGAIPNSELTIDGSSQIPAFLGPDADVAPLYVKAVGGSTIVPIYPRVDSVFAMTGTRLTLPGNLGIGTSASATIPLDAARSTAGQLARLVRTSTSDTAALLEILGGEASSNNLVLAVNADAQSRFVVRADGRIDWGSGSAARDTNLYRSAADTLKTDDALIVTGACTVGSLTTAGALAAGASTLGATTATTDGTTSALYAKTTATGTATLAVARVETNATGKRGFDYKVTGDSESRLRIDTSATGNPGTIVFGNGTTVDTNLYRSAADTLKTDDTFTAADVQVGGTSLGRGILGQTTKSDADQTGVTTEADLTDLSVTVTVAANRKIIIVGEAQIAGGTADMRAFLRAKESTTVLGLCVVTIRVSSSNTYATARVETPIQTPSGGSHTYKLSLEGSGGTARANHATTFAGWIRVIDVGPA